MRRVVGILAVVFLLVSVSYADDGGWKQSQTVPSPTWNKITGPHYLVMIGQNGEEIIRISDTGEVYYKGKLLGTDTEVWWGIRAAFSPGEICERWEKTIPGLSPRVP